MEMDQARQPLISYQGTLPDKLYRYRSVSPTNLDRLIDFEILEEAIYLAGLKDLNDPDEGRFIVEFSGTRDESIAYWKKVLGDSDERLLASDLDRLATARTDDLLAAQGRLPRAVVDHLRYVFEHVLRVACFTTLPTNYSMWANYAKYFAGATSDAAPTPSLDHGGICIEYRCNDGWRALNLHPVVYSDDIPIINPAERDEAKLVKAVFAKSAEWRCENEWRIFSTLQALPPFPDNLTTNAKVRFENSVSGVVFGMRTPDELVAEVSRRVRQAGRVLSLKRVVRDPTTYARVLQDIEHT